MKIERVLYSRTVNLGDYNSERIEIGAIVEEGEDFKEVLSKVKKEVNISLKLESPKEEEKESEKPAVTKKKTSKKVAKKKVKHTVKANQKAAIEKSGRKVNKKKPVGPTAVKKKDATLFDKTIPNHKTLFIEVVDKIKDGSEWKNDSDFVKEVKTAINEMQGKDFIDSSGEVTSSFIEELTEKLNA